MRIPHLIAFCLLAACEQRSSSSVPDVSRAGIVDAAPEGCGAIAPEQLRFPFRSGDNNTECDEPGARHYWLRVRSPERMHFWAASVIVMPYHEEAGLSLYGVGVAGSSRIEPESPLGQALACEALAGNRPTIEVEFCAPSDRAAGFSVLAIFEPGHRQVAFNGSNPGQQSQVLELRGVDGTIFPLEPISFQRRGMEGANTIEAFHIPGTPMFSPTESESSFITLGDRPARRHHRR